MRERSTWNRTEIARTASFGRRAEDPRAMNQDHLKQQPAADAYVTGGPSEFAEDVHPSAGTWKAEYSGGEVSRNEIGMPEMRKDTFNHPEKTASLDEETILAKADLATKVARSMLHKNASDAQVEDQALALMYIPDAALVETANRLAKVVADDDGEGDQGQDEGQDQGQQKQARAIANDEKKQGQGQDEKKQSQQQAKESEQDEKKQGKQAGQMPPQFRENAEKKKEEAKDKKDGDKDQGQDKGQKQASAGDLFVAAIKSGNGQGVEQALASMIAQAMQQLGQGQQQSAVYGQGQDQQPMAQGQNQQPMAQGQNQQPMAQGQNQQPMAQGQNQQPMAQGQNQQPMAQGQNQQPMAGQGLMSDDQLLDQMLQDDMGMGQPQMMAAGEAPEIQLEANTMDVGEVSLDAQDEVLNSLFAANAEYQNAAEAHALTTGQPITASRPQTMTRTAATRTVGTRPTAGVSQIGGGVSGNPGGNEVDKLANLWQSAPDVSNVFR